MHIVIISVSWCWDLKFNFFDDLIVSYIKDQNQDQNTHKTKHFTLKTKIEKTKVKRLLRLSQIFLSFYITRVLHYKIYIFHNVQNFKSILSLKNQSKSKMFNLFFVWGLSQVNSVYIPRFHYKTFMILRGSCLVSIKFAFWNEINFWRFRLSHDRIAIIKFINLIGFYVLCI